MTKTRLPVLNLEHILLLIYEIGLAVLLVLVGPFLLFRRKARAGLLQKLGIVSTALRAQLENLSNPVWFHAVSVGEFNAAWPFIQAFHDRFPNKALVISTTTETGQILARQRAGEIATIIYFPFDLPWVISKWLSIIRPSLVVILETELWPCFSEAGFRRSIPLAILNGRISLKSYRLLQIVKPVFGPLLRKFALIGAQSGVEANRYVAIGGDNLPIAVFGNLKYDGLSTIDTDDSELKDNLRKELNISESELVLIAGSTHEGEEALVLNVLKRFSPKGDLQISPLRLIVAPRHPERFERVARIISSYGYNVKRRSLGQSFLSAADVFLLDTIGCLTRFYSVASLAFVGGTVAKVGGHNLVEPYAYGVPVVCGPSLYKTKDTATILSERNALSIGKNRKDVEDRIMTFLASPHLRTSAGKNGKAWLAENQGASQRALRHIERFITITPKERPPLVKGSNRNAARRHYTTG